MSGGFSRMRTSVFLKNYSKGVLLFVEEARSSEGARQTGRRRSAAARSRSASLHGRAPLTELRLVQVCGRSHIRWNRGPGGLHGHSARLPDTRQGRPHPDTCEHGHGQQKGLRRHRFLPQILPSTCTRTNPPHLILTGLSADPTPDLLWIWAHTHR